MISFPRNVPLLNDLDIYVFAFLPSERATQKPEDG
jgi:hypothetical protein